MVKLAMSTREEADEVFSETLGWTNELNFLDEDEILSVLKSNRIPRQERKSIYVFYKRKKFFKTLYETIPVVVTGALAGIVFETLQTSFKKEKGDDK